MTSSEIVSALSGTERGLVDYSKELVLELRSPADKDANQEFFPFLRPNKTPRKRVHRITLSNGEQICVINCDRFVDALVQCNIEIGHRFVRVLAWQLNV